MPIRTGFALVAQAGMTELSRDEGARIERELVALHAEIGAKIERVPISAARR